MSEQEKLEYAKARSRELEKTSSPWYFEDEAKRVNRDFSKQNKGQVVHSSVAVPIRKAALFAFNRSEGTKLPWINPKLSRAERVEVFLRELKVTSGKDAGEELKLRPFQREFIEGVYREDEEGKRPVRTAILSIARKNGKTALAAGLALAHLCGPEQENRGEVYSCANDRFQASKIFQEMYAMIESNPWLLARTKVQHYHKTIYDLMTGSVYIALSRESSTKMGLNPSFVVYDEYGLADDDDLYRAMDSAMGARQNPLLMVISTQAANDAAPLSRLIDYGLRIKNGDVNDETFHLTLHTTDPLEDIFSEETWRKANPALDDFRSLEDVERLASQAKRMPGQENSFRNLILNQRTAAYTPFVKPHAWKACSKKSELEPGAKVYAALDLGSAVDMTALVLVAEDIEGIFHVEPYFWLPGNIEERESEDRAPYQEWVNQGILYHEEEATDPKAVALKVAELNGRYRIQLLAFDRWRINDFKRCLGEIGAAIKLIPHGQGYKEMSPAVDVLERLIIQKRIRHGGHPILNMNAFNAIVTKDAAGNRKLDKAKSKGKIDGIVALAMAFSAALIKSQDQPTAPTPVDIEALIG